ncbi:MAG TPA: beta-ketoacyl-ACP synthase [Acidiferrobacter sp.]|nr:beta-ketoacyl-ACP synthase [Acidiferrobacter sp.]
MKESARLEIGHTTLVSALGRGLKQTLATLRGDRSGLQSYTAVGGLVCDVGRVSGVADVRVPGELSRYACRNNNLAMLALETDGFAEAVRRLMQKVGAERIGVVVGTSTSGIAATEAAYRDPNFGITGTIAPDFPYRETHNVFSSADFTLRYLGLKGPAFVISTACSSSAKAFGTATRLIRSGLCRAVVVGGVDSLCDTTLYGFQSLGLLSGTRTRPFSAGRDGISIGEAAGFTILAEPGVLEGAGMVLAGIGDSADAYHMTAPHPEGLGAWEAMAGALAAAHYDPSDLDYIHLHGTGTAHNDAAEDLAIQKLGCHETPVSSTKGATGHTLGAAGICAVAITELAMGAGFIPGTINTEARDPALQSALVLAGRRGRVRRALVNTFGFGGSNCCLVLEARS